MQLTLRRVQENETCTIGKLFVDGEFECYTLERVAGPDHNDCIPAGDYTVDITYSNRFGRMMPEVENVPGFTGIRIHQGNTVADTEGCILVGATRGENCIYQSALAFELLYGKLQNCHDPIMLKITNEF